MARSVWNGTQDIGIELVNIINRNCSCKYGVMGIRLSSCATHAMLLDQRVLNGLLFARALRDRFLREEFAE